MPPTPLLRTFGTLSHPQAYANYFALATLANNQIHVPKRYTVGGRCCVYNKLRYRVWLGFQIEQNRGAYMSVKGQELREQIPLDS